MTPRRPHLEDLDVLVLVARLGSIGRAAAELGLSQPSVSRRMAALERALKVTLLHRTTHGSTLTPAGRVVVDWAATLLAATDDFSRSVDSLRGRQAVAVRVAVSMTIAEHYAPAWLARLHAQHPEVAVAMEVHNSTEVADRVEEGVVELGFVESPTVRRTLRRRRIGWDRLTVAVAPAHPWASRRKPVTAAELAEEPLLVREPGSGTRETVEETLRRGGLEVSAGLEMASNTALKASAVAGIGPVVLSEVALAAELATGALAVVPTVGIELRRPLTAVWRRDATLREAALALLGASSLAN